MKELNQYAYKSQHEEFDFIQLAFSVLKKKAVFYKKNYIHRRDVNLIFSQIFSFDKSTTHQCLKVMVSRNMIRFRNRGIEILNGDGLWKNNHNQI